MVKTIAVAESSPIGAARLNRGSLAKVGRRGIQLSPSLLGRGVPPGRAQEIAITSIPECWLHNKYCRKGSYYQLMVISQVEEI